MEERLNRLLERIKIKHFPILAMLTSIIIVSMAFAFTSVAPGGFRMLYVSDFYGEYLNFLTNLKHIFQGKESLIYSWNIDLGMGIVGLNAYYMSSPLNLLILWLGEKYLIHGAVCLVILRVGLASLCAYVCLRYIYILRKKVTLLDSSEINSRYKMFGLLVIAVCYSMCGWIMNNFFNVLWQDALFIFPLVIMFIIKLVNEKKVKGLIITLLYIFISNYYMGYMIGIIGFVFFVILCIVYLKYQKADKKEILLICARFILAVIDSILLASALLLPSYLQIKDKMSGNCIDISECKFDFGLLGFVNGLYTNSYTSLENGNPNIYTGLIVFVLVSIYLIYKVDTERKDNASKKIKEKRIVVISILCFVIVASFRITNIFLHAMDKPDWFSYRYSFAFSFFFCIISTLTYDKAISLELKYIVKIIAVLESILIGYFAVSNFMYTIANNEILKDYGIFRCRLSELIINTVLLMALLAIYAAYNNKKIIKRDFCLLIIVFITIEECINFADIVRNINNESGFFNYDYVQEEVSFLSDQIMELSQKDKDFYRIESNHIVSHNDSYAIGYRGITNYTSVCNEKLNDTLYNLGLMVNDWRLDYEGQTKFVESILNVKYMMHFKPRSWLDSTEINEDFYVDENKYYLPVGFMTSNNIQKISINDEHTTQIEKQKKLLSSMTGELDKSFIELIEQDYSIELTNIMRRENSDGSVVYRKKDQSEQAYIRYDIPYDSNYRYYYCYDYDFSKGYYDGDISTSSRYDENSISTAKKKLKVPRIVQIDDNVDSNSKSISIVIRIDEDKVEFLSEGLYRYDDKEYKKNYDLLSKNTINILSVDNTRLLGEITSDYNGTLFTSIPYDKGWVVKVDGLESNKISLVDGAFLGVELSKGEHTIELRYIPEGMNIGIVMSIIGLCLFVVIIVFEKKVGKNINNLYISA